MANRLLKAVTAGIGALHADSTEEQARDALDKSVEVFLLKGDKGAVIAKSIHTGSGECANRYPFFSQFSFFSHCA